MADTEEERPACPHCWHLHLDYDDDDCVSCGCPAWEAGPRDVYLRELASDARLREAVMAALDEWGELVETDADGNGLGRIPADGTRLEAALRAALREGPTP